MFGFIHKEKESDNKTLSTVPTNVDDRVIGDVVLLSKEMVAHLIQENDLYVNRHRQ